MMRSFRQHLELRPPVPRPRGMIQLYGIVLDERPVEGPCIECGKGGVYAARLRAFVALLAR